MADDASAPFHTLGSEPLQHEYIGNSVKLKYYEDSEISGKDLNFGQFKLSFGRIVALAGDFYASYTVGLGDLDQLSDNWYIHPMRSVDLALELAEDILHDKGDYLGPLTKLLDEQREKLECIQQNRDIAQTYSGIASDYNTKYIDATKTKDDKIGSCQRIALCNWDNFGQNAIKAYSAAHRAALEKAHEAKTSIERDKEVYKQELDNATEVHLAAFNEAGKAYERALYAAVNDNELPSCDEKSLFLKKTQDAQDAHVKAIDISTSNYAASIKSTLDEVYVREAFAQHYLSVLFLAGHLRAPRRELHKIFYGEQDYPVDRCAQAMHDEDNANGLWVTNNAGDAWWMYGDQQLWDGTGSKNFEIAMAAAQASVDEIWETQVSGVIPLRFRALNKVPILDRLDPPYNYTPLFRQDPGTDLIIHLRASDLRDNTLFGPVWTFDSHRSYGLWKEVLGKISRNRFHPPTEPFEVSDVIWDLKATPKALIVNWYCSHLSPADPSGPWIIRHQSVIPHNFPKDFILDYSDQVGESSYCLILGRVTKGNGKYSRYYLRVRIELSKTGKRSIWSQIFPGDISTSPDIIAHNKELIAIYSKREETDTEVEIYYVSDDPTNYGMTKTREYRFSHPINFMLFYTITSNESSNDYICCYRYDPMSKQTSWIFALPPKDTTELSQSHRVVFPDDPELSAAPKTLLPLDHRGNPWLIRLFDNRENKIRIDFIRFKLDEDKKIKQTVLTQELDMVNWESFWESEWYTGDVSLKQQRMNDLIGLAPGDAPGVLRMVVFPNLCETEPRFGQPTISDIKCPAEVLESVGQVVQVNTRFRSNTGFLMLLDSGGTVGAQYLCPVHNSYEYKLGGRISAIAGTSTGLSAPEWYTGKEQQSIEFYTNLGFIRGKLDPPGNKVYKYFVGLEISQDLLDRCARLYNSQYGVWSALTPNNGQYLSITKKDFKDQYFSSQDDNHNVLITCHYGASLIGYVFGAVWDYDGGAVGWVTQLVVDRNYRQHHIATYLIQMLKCHNLFQNITAIGIASHHPAACQALAKLKHLHIGDLHPDSEELNFCKLNAPKILEKTPIPRLQNRVLRGKLFETNCVTSTVSLIDTQFHVDHTQALEVLKTYEEQKRWHLGKLMEGHEFILVLKS